MNGVAHPYLALKLAQQLYKKNPDALSLEEQVRIAAAVTKQQHLETLILATQEASHVILPPSSLQSSLTEIRQRYASEEDFQADLDRIGLTEASLSAAIERDLTVEAVLEKVATRAAKVSSTDVEIFYFMHRDRFTRRATRSLRHILITINPDYQENDRAIALARLETIRKRLLRDPKRFEEQALKHSECPTAMNGGLIGRVSAGQLYAELEPIAFALQIGELSPVVESPIGYHLIRCDAIHASETMSLDEARPRVYRHLMDQRRRICQKAWINSLVASAKNA